MSAEETYSRWLAWYEDDPDYQPTDGIPSATWPDRDEDESLSHYIVRCDVADLLAEVRRLQDQVSEQAAALAREKELREAFEGAAADLAQANVAEVKALRKVIAVQERARAALAGEQRRHVPLCGVNARGGPHDTCACWCHTAALAGEQP